MNSIHSRLNLSIIAIFLAGTPGCTAFDVLNAPVPRCGYVRTNDIPYGPLPRQKLDVYRPTGIKSGGPVVIFFYGGEWQAGEKADYRFAAEALTSRGFVVVLPDYRIYPDGKFPDFVNDGAAAVRWAHDHVAEFGGDPTKLHLMGHSAGAHIVALLTLDGHYLHDVGLERSEIRGTVGLAGPYDFQPQGTDRLIFNMKSGDMKPDPAIQPVTFADGQAPPMLLIQGMKDDLVDPRNAFELATLIRRAGGKADVIFYPDEGHRSVLVAMAWEFRWIAPTLDDAAVFLRKH